MENNKLKYMENSENTSERTVDENLTTDWIKQDVFKELYKETQIEYTEHCEFFNGKPNCTFEEMLYFRLEEIMGMVI